MGKRKKKNKFKIQLDQEDCKVSSNIENEGVTPTSKVDFSIFNALDTC